MTEKDLSYEAYKILLKGRKKYSAFVLIFLVVFAILGYGYIGYNQMFYDSWWFTPLLLILGFLVKIFFRPLLELLENFANSKCPRCSELLEKHQIIGNPMPTHCKYCGLEIKGRGK